MIVVDGNVNTMRHLAYGVEHHPATLAFLQGQVAQATNFASMAVGDAARSFFGRAQQTFEEHHSAEAMRLARLALQKTQSVAQLDMVRDIWQLGQLQSAPPVMQRFIMANPFVRQMYHDQRIDGYSGTYEDYAPGQVGPDHYDYRRVMDGVMIVGDQESEADWEAVMYMDPLEEGDRELTSDQQADILSTWDVVEAYLKESTDDPTSPSGGKL